MKKTSILVLAILLLMACTKDSSQDSLSVENAEAKQNNGKRVTRPITNSLQSDPDFSLPPLSCSNGPGIGGGAMIYGNTSHMGKVTGQAVNQACEYLADGRLRLTSKDVTIAANGEKIYTEGEIFITIVSATMATVTGGSQITGGTGRFAGATGYFIYENMVLDLLTGHESHTAYGEITY